MKYELATLLLVNSLAGGQEALSLKSPFPLPNGQGPSLTRQVIEIVAPYSCGSHFPEFGARI